MTDNVENARGLARAMLDAGKEPLWVTLVVGWYYGRQGRQAALDLLEERELVYFAG